MWKQVQILCLLVILNLRYYFMCMQLDNIPLFGCFFFAQFLFLGVCTLHNPVPPSQVHTIGLQYKLCRFKWPVWIPSSSLWTEAGHISLLHQNVCILKNRSTFPLRKYHSEQLVVSHYQPLRKVSVITTLYHFCPCKRKSFDYSSVQHDPEDRKMPTLSQRTSRQRLRFSSYLSET